MEYRGFIVWGAGTFVLLLVFLIFMAVGWPGKPDTCTNIDPATGVQTAQAAGDPPDTCYCEHFSVSDVFHNKGGIRQPVNTWFNLYAILTSLLVAWQIWRDRQVNSGENPMKRATNWLPDVYIFAVLFLGLGSMWFHASLTRDVAWLDGFSMYMYTAFLLYYAIYCYSTDSGKTLWIIPRGVFFGVAYPVTAIVFTILGQVLGDKWPHAPVSAILIGTIVVGYLVAEGFVTWGRQPYAGRTTGAKVYIATCWIGGALAFLFAFLFWKFSQTGERLCDPMSFFQPHGLLWHPLAGIMAVLLYYFWREGNDSYNPTEI